MTKTQSFASGVGVLLLLGVLAAELWPTRSYADHPVLARFLTPNWILLDRPASPNGGINGAFCLDELRCWFGATSYDAIPPYSTLYRTSDGGLTWQNQDFQGVGFSRIVFFNEAIGFTNAFRTADGGKTWQRVMVGDRQLSNLIFVDKRIGYACATDQLPYLTFKTTNGGETWQQWSGSCPGYGAVFLNEDIAWRIASKGAVSYTTDGWRSHYQIQVGTEDDTFAVLDFVNYRTGWIGGYRLITKGENSPSSEAVLYHTRDAGQTWERLYLPPPFRFISHIDFVNERNGWMTASTLTGSSILRTDDGGDTWTLEVEFNRSGTCVDCGVFVGFLYFVNEQLGWAAIGEWNPIVCCYYKLYKHYPNIALTPTPTATPTPGPEARQNVIPRLYQEVLCRGIDSQGYQYWLNSPLTTEQIRQELINSPEGQRVAAVRSLYTSILARDPMPTDCGGLRSWVDSSLSLDAIRASLEASGEGQRVATVRQLYIELLGRDPLGSDNAGLRYWVQLPLPISDIRRLIMESEEYRRTHGG